MPLVSLQDVFEQIEPDIPLAGSALVMQKLRDTARDFCQFSRGWQWDAPLASVVANQESYNIVTLGDSEPVTILYMSVDGTEVFPKDTAWLDMNITGWRTASGDDFRFYTQESRRTFRFPSIPLTAKANAIFYRLALKPGPSSDEIDEDVWSDWYDVLGAGTKSRLMMMPNKPWSDARTGAFHGRVYEIGRAKARIRYNKNFTDVEQSFHSTRRFA